MQVQGEPSYLMWSNMTDIMFLNILGVFICLYSLYVEIKKEKDPKYRAMCDFNEHMSCSRVLTSEYSHGFGFMGVLFGENHILNARNCNLGLVVYITHFLACLLLSPTLASTILYYSAVISVLGCVYLAIILFFVLKDFCLVCVTMYAINGTLLYLTYNMHKFYH